MCKNDATKESFHILDECEP